MNRVSSGASRTCVAVLTADAAFEQSLRATFGTGGQIELRVISGSISTAADLVTDDLTVVIVDLDAGRPEEMQALERLMLRASLPPVVVVAQNFDADVARSLLQIRVADFLVKPVQPVELVRTCARVARSKGAETTEAQIYTFIPAVGGAGVTTLAIQTALLLLNSGQRSRPSTCLVDLDFQHGACADYLDLEPRLELKEIEHRPERLDRQLLEIMLSHHSSGLEVIAAPNRPAEMRSFDPDMVTRLLDLVSSHFDYVVIDMPRTWFSWTDSVLLGTNKLFIVSEMTVPSLKQARGLVGAIRERLGDGPQPQVIVNRFEQRMFEAGLKKSDVEQALGDDFAGTVPNNYRLVREAIDRGVPIDEVKPGNNISVQLKKLMIPQQAAKAASADAQGLMKRLSLSIAK
ncbi:AAA family ATPase [Rhodoplanes sp. Z2-YC6860]|uniref:AAA family ATPase n=1 Tax=Rhodoplanes sp. Z2-YC6860 TaxID=674703 RepID=UPI00078C2377|nr:response regulator receiver protein [Rhodoplanes sp. Z2-YC6860]AMN38863.1 Flp pilus assembly protein, ATPase CpaE [Rhodoplanes sp. Z2-YC6860]